MDNNFTNNHSDNEELEPKSSAVTPIVPEPEPLAGLNTVNDVNMGQAPAMDMPNPSMGQMPDAGTVMGQAPGMGQNTEMGQTPGTGQTPGRGPSTGGGQTPGMNQTMYGQAPGMGKTMYGQTPGMNQTMYGQAPGMGQTMYGQAPGANQTMYGQTAFGQNPGMDQTMYGQAPYGTDYSSLGQGLQPAGKKQKLKKPKKPKKPMTKGKIAGIIAGSTAGVAAVVCGVIFIPKLFQSPKEVVLDAVENTFGISSDTNNVENDKYGINETFNEYWLNGGDMNITVTVDGSTYGVSDTMALAVDSAYDPNAKLANCDVSLLYNGTDVASLDLIGTENTTYFQIPGLINGYFSFPNDLSTLLTSPMLSGVDIPVDFPTTTINYFEQSEQLAENGADLNSGYVNAFETLWDNVSVDKKGKKKIEVNGETVKATKYVVTVEEEDIEKAVQNALEGVLEMAEEDAALLEEQGLTAEDLELLMSQFDVKSLITGDFSFNVYVKDDKVVKIEASDTATIMYVKLDYDFYLDIDDNNISCELSLSVPMAETSVKFGFFINDLKGNTNGQFYVTADDENYDLSFDSVRTERGTAVSRNFTYSLNGNGVSVIKGSFDITTDSADNSFDIDLSLMADGEEMEIIVSGAITDFVPGQSFAISIDKISFGVEGSDTIEFALDYSVNTGSSSAHNIDSSIPVYNLETMTQEEFEAIIVDNTGLIMQWTSDFIMNTGELGQALMELLETTSDDMDYQEEYEDYEDYEESESSDLSFSDAYLNEDGYSVKIESGLDGFTLDYISDYFVDLVNANNTYIEYEINTYETVEELLTGMDALDCDVLDYVENETIDQDGMEIHYSKIEYNAGYGDKTIYKFARYMDEDVYLVMTVTYDSAYDSFTADELVMGITDRYVTIL